MKKGLSLLVAVVLLAAFMAGCGGAASSTAAPSAAPAQTSAAAPAEGPSTATGGDNAGKIAAICSAGGLGDNGYNDSAKKGLDMAKDQFGVDYTIVEPTEVSQGETYLRQFAKEGYGLVATFEYGHADAVNTVAQEFPDTLFAVFNLVVDQPNVISVVFDVQDPSYLAGVIAGEMTKPDVTVVEGRDMKEGSSLGFIGGSDSPGIQVCYHAFYQGARSVNPDVTVYADFTVGFSDTQNAKTIADNMINSQNVDIIFASCGLAARGIYQAARENNVFAIGSSDNQDSLEPGFMITSVQKRMDTALASLGESLSKGELAGGERRMTLEEGGTTLTDFAELKKVITNEAEWDRIMAEVDKAQADIIAGNIQVVDNTKGEVFEP